MTETPGFLHFLGQTDAVGHLILAVLLVMSVATYERLARRGSFHRALTDFRARLHVDSLGIDPEQLAATRDPASGREVAL